MPTTGTTIERSAGHPSAGPPGLHCLIVDDQPVTLDRLTRTLLAHPSVAQVSAATDAAGALRRLHETEIDVAFIEAGIPDLDGVELAWILRRFLVAPAIVFVTRHPDRAADAFDVGAVDYVVKPARPDRLAESLRRVIAGRPDRTAGATFGAAVDPDPAGVAGTPDDAAGPPSAVGDEAIPVELAGTTKLVRRSSVRWVQGWGDYARLHTADGSHLIRARLAALADRWRSAGLVRIHRSYLVQLRFVADVRVTECGTLTVVVDGHQLPVSRRAAPALRDRLLSAARSATAATS
jgi:DNA-binding LytR/AlgR family response regulator